MRTHRRPGFVGPFALHRALRRMAGLVFLFGFWALAGACPRHGVLLCSSSSSPAGLCDGPISRRDATRRMGPLCHWAGELTGRRVTETTSRRARKPQDNKPAPSAPTARILQGAMRECDVPVPPCSAFPLLSSLSHSRAWSLAVTRRATQVCRRNRNHPRSGWRATALARSDYPTAMSESAPSVAFFFRGSLRAPRRGDEAEQLMCVVRRLAKGADGEARNDM